jgi:hypothetical protein
VSESVEVVGAGAMAADLERIAKPGGAFDEATQHAAQQLLTPVAATARGSIPQVSGAMAASVHVKPEAWGAALSEGDGLVYAGWVDFGGSRPQSGARDYRPQGRYLFPAVGDLEPAALHDVDDALQGAIGRFGWTNTGDNPGVIHG